MSQTIVDEQLSRIEQDKSYYLFNHNLITHFSAEMLTPTYWQDNNEVTGSAQGRGTTWFVAYQDENNNQHDWVLRHYYRGGLIGRVIKDSYFFTGISNTRAAREFALLLHMQQLGLPAPQPIAYRVIRHHLTYQADLLSSRIMQANDLVAILSQAPLDKSLWLAIGATIKGFHDHNIYHHDLNAHNILINNQNRVFLIDFDRGEIRNTEANQSKNAAWKQANMQRLQRSFLKEKNKLAQFYFTDENWQTLIKGYHTGV
ncbi:3-deoxy-D-manno-octulosonic acid kinase [Colwelliaceae bacterium MEBiC 14330]